MDRPKVVVHSLLVKNPDIEAEILSTIDADLVFIPNEDVEIFFEEIKDADGIIIANRQIKAEVVNTLRNCKIITRQGIGFDSIDLINTGEKNIVVTNVPDYCLDEVADFTLALILSMSRHIPTYDRHVKEGVWDIQSIYTRSGYPSM